MDVFAPDQWPGWERLAIGSVIDRVLSRSKVPLMLMRTRAKLETAQAA